MPHGTPGCMDAVVPVVNDSVPGAASGSVHAAKFRNLSLTKGEIVLTLRNPRGLQFGKIRNIRHKGLKRLYEDDHPRGVSPEHAPAFPTRGKGVVEQPFSLAFAWNT